MLLDSSDDESEDEIIVEPVRDIDDNSDTVLDVPEYAAEIHQYLKAAEVQLTWKYLNHFIFTQMFISTRAMYATKEQKINALLPHIKFLLDFPYMLAWERAFVLLS